MAKKKIKEQEQEQEEQELSPEEMKALARERRDENLAALKTAQRVAREVFGEAVAARDRAVVFGVAEVLEAFGGDEGMVVSHLREARKLAEKITLSPTDKEVLDVGEALFDGGEGAEEHLLDAAEVMRSIFESQGDSVEAVLDVYCELYPPCKGCGASTMLDEVGYCGDCR